VNSAVALFRLPCMAHLVRKLFKKNRVLWTLQLITIKSQSDLMTPVMMMTLMNSEAKLLDSNRTNFSFKHKKVSIRTDFQTIKTTTSRTLLIRMWVFMTCLIWGIWIGLHLMLRP